MDYYGGVEGGGTKIKCIIATDPEHIYAESTFQTTTPEETLPKLILFFKNFETERKIKLKAMGLAFFGPLDLNPTSEAYGFITSTPKPGWNDFPLLNYFKGKFNIPLALNTDVNTAALAEGNLGAASGLNHFIYITVGTGIGAGIIVNGKPLQGLTHAEVGHMRIFQNPRSDPFEGICHYHGNCLEGLASGPAITLRCGMVSSLIPSNHPVWDIEAFYLGQMIMNLVLSFSPQRIILGGGVMQKQGLLQKVRANFVQLLNNYIYLSDYEDLDIYIQPSALGSQAGVLGALLLAMQTSLLTSTS